MDFRTGRLFFPPDVSATVTIEYQPSLGIIQLPLDDVAYYRFVAEDVESEYVRGLLTFWKGPYYGSVLAYPVSDAKKTLIRELAAGVAAGIADEGETPAALANAVADALGREDIALPLSPPVLWRLIHEGDG